MGNLVQDKVIIVTGGGQGLGRTYSLALAGDGARVVIADINGEKAAAVRDEIVGNGGTALAVQTDVTDEAAVQRMAEETLSAFGRIDGLINNAAVLATLTLKPFWELTLDEWEHVMAVNVRGVWLCSKAVAEAMIRQEKGKIVNVASGVALTGREDFLHYVTSKAAVLGLTRGLARELGPYNINVNTIMPGPIVTEVPRETMDETRASALMARQCIKRLIRPNDLIGTILFLCSDHSDMVTGQTIPVNGGSSMV